MTSISPTRNASIGVARILVTWLLVPSGFVLLSGMLDGSGRVSLLNENFELAYAVTNALPGLLLMALLWAASGRAALSILAPAAIYAAILGINRLKLAHLQSPLMPQDIEFLINAPASSVSLFSNYIPWHRLLLFASATAIALTMLLRWVHRRFRPSPRGPLRAITGGLALVALLSLLVPGALAGRVYNSERSVAASFDALLSEAKFPGVVNNLMAPKQRYAGYFREGMPQVAADAVRRAFLPDAPPECSAPASPNSAPDIVFVQSEAFFDVAKLNGMGSTEATPNFRTLSEQGVHGDLYVPTLGGNTIRTEYEVITGQPLWADPEIIYPYFEVGAFDMPSLVSTLNEHGYETVSVHANSGAFWRRSDTFREMGFGRQIWADSFAGADRSDFYIPDRFMTDEILRALQAPRNAPRMVYAISIENHGPYEYHPVGYHQSHDTKPESEYQLPRSLPSNERAKLRTYLYHLANVDHELGRLASSLRQSGRPTILVFFGDHLPALPNVFDTQQMVSGMSKDRQPTSWLMVDMREQSPSSQSVDIASWQLAAQVLKQAGICDPYFAVAAAADPALARLTSTAERDPRPGTEAVKAARESALQLALLQRSGQVCAAYHQLPEAVSSQVCPREGTRPSRDQ